MIPPEISESGKKIDLEPLPGSKRLYQHTSTIIIMICADNVVYMIQRIHRTRISNAVTK
jgi:hypothetical protein